MKPLLPLALLLFSLTASAQKIAFKINAGGSITLLRDFQHRIFIVDGFVVPGKVSLDNARNPPVVEETTEK